jgi:UDP-N-acetylmuramate: L-alanyl-gamma-D-glutamyl-meso-diaminopimelate ligase
MRVHILGICGTFMGGIAALAREAGHDVTGSDQNVYPPMSTQLEALGIRLTEGYLPSQLEPTPDVVVVGNALSRGNPVIEAVLNRGLAYTSGPAWLAEHVLADRWVLAVAGTHGKTTTSGMLTWILERAGLEPGFLIGGVPGNFTASARLGKSPFFVVEADEYDTAFFDKRAKFVHYRPLTAILNNLEFDHADIYPDIASIRKMFNQLVRTVPSDGRLIVNGADSELRATLAMGAWTPVETFSRHHDADFGVHALAPDWSSFEIRHGSLVMGAVEWGLIGAHNAENALAAVLAARHAGVPVQSALQALPSFKNARRRMEVRGIVHDITVYDDFAHHPTAIATTLDGLRKKVGDARIVAVLEPRSATMRLGIHRDTLADSLLAADKVFIFEPAELGWDVRGAVSSLGERACVCDDLDALVHQIVECARSGDQILVMSNGGFGGLHVKLLTALGRLP